MTTEKEKDAMRQYRIEHRDELNAYYRDYYKNKPEQREKKLAASRRRYWEKKTAALVVSAVVAEEESCSSYMKPDSIESYIARRSEYLLYTDADDGGDTEEMRTYEREARALAEKYRRGKGSGGRKKTLARLVVEAIIRDDVLTDTEKILIGSLLVEEDLTACVEVLQQMECLSDEYRFRVYTELALDQKRWSEYNPTGVACADKSPTRYRKVAELANDYFRNKNKKRERY